MSSPSLQSVTTSPDNELTALKWRDTMSQFASGVTVITTHNEQGRATGTTVSAFSSLSLEPMLLIVCLDKRSNTLLNLLSHQRFAVNILAQPQQQVAFQCGSRNEDKFSRINYYHGEHGLPLIDGCCAHIECTLHQNIDAGDHTIIIGKPLSITTYPEHAPMIYHRGKFLDL